MLTIRDSERVFVDLDSFFRRRTVGLFDNLKYLSGRRLPDMCVCEVERGEEKLSFFEITKLR